MSKFTSLAALLLSICFLASCTGPRNIYSASPFVSPVAMDKGATAIDASYFSHTRQTNAGAQGNHDNGIGLNLSHMIGEKWLAFVSTDLKKERNQFGDSIRLPGDPSFNAYNAGFDSSLVFGTRYSVGGGIEFFPGDHENKVTNSLALSAAWHQSRLRESGLLQRTPYHRFYDVNQISLSLQHNLLFRINSSFNLAWVIRLTILNSFRANTDYSEEEKIDSGLHDKSLKAFFCGT